MPGAIGPNDAGPGRHRLARRLSFDKGLQQQALIARRHPVGLAWGQLRLPGIQPQGHHGRIATEAGIDEPGATLDHGPQHHGHERACAVVELGFFQPIQQFAEQLVQCLLLLAGQWLKQARFVLHMQGNQPVDQLAPQFGERYQRAAAVIGIG